MFMFLLSCVFKEYHMTILKDQQKLYDNVIIKLDKKGTTRRTYGFYHLLLSAYCVST